jgi:arsenate reductase
VKILFMCVENSARSQLAEGLALKTLPGAEVQSAGSHPGRLNPYAVAAMREIGVDISNHYSKSIDDLSPQFITGIDYVITLCAEEVCPELVSKAIKLHWPHPDPATKETLSEAEAMDRFRSVRDAIQRQLHEFKREIDAMTTTFGNF